MSINEILRKYTTGELTLDEANEKLKEERSDLTLNPDRNTITQEEFMETTAGDYPPATVNGYGLMDHGVGCLEKVHVVDGKTPDVNMGEEVAFVFIAGRRYRLWGDVLREED